VTEQPPSQPPAEEPEGDTPAALVSDEAPTQVSAPATAPEPAVAPEAPPAPPAAFAPADAPTAPATATPPPPATPPPLSTDLPSDEGASAGPSGLAAAFPPEHPERALGAAFGGGLVLALILKRLAR
jgi:pyruvate dehydrogenase E2 component (dihydrolipoamide acetyltransferase)